MYKFVLSCGLLVSHFMVYLECYKQPTCGRVSIQGANS